MRVFVAAAVAAGLAGCQWIPGTDAHAIAKGKKVVADGLFDPDAAQFRNVRLGTALDGSQEPTLCGEVNGKNRHGAYVGFTRFILPLGRDDVYMDPRHDVTPSEVERQQQECQAELARRRYGSTPYSCERALSAYDELVEQVSFDQLFSESCEGQQSRSAPPAEE